MSYRVDWKETAEQELAAVYLAASDQHAVAVAADWLERRLARDALSFGESRESTLHRIGFYPPVAFEYEVVPDDLRVIIHGVFAVG